MKLYQIAVIILFGHLLFTWELSAQSSQLFDGNCTNVTGPRTGLTMDGFFGTWYTLAHIPRIPDQDAICIVTEIYPVNSTVFFDRYWIDPSTNQINKAYGYFTFENGTAYAVFVHPFEYVVPNNFIGLGSEFFAAYSCNECGYYGTQDGGMHPYIFTRTPNPNCTVTDPIWELLASKNISKNVFTLVDHSACQPLITYINDLHAPTESPST